MKTRLLPVLSPVLGTLIATVAIAAPPKFATDGWFYANDIDAPNVTRSGDQFVLRVDVLSIARTVTTKPVTVEVTYVQRVPGSPSKINNGVCNPSTLTSKGNDCDQVISKTTVLTVANVKVGERRKIIVPIVGNKPAEACTASGNCNGTAKISFVNNAGVRPTLKVTWTQKQNGNAEDLDVVISNPKT